MKLVKLQAVARTLIAVSLVTLSGGLLRAQCTPATPANCAISPAQAEINLGPLPVDRYSTAFQNNGTIPSCAPTISVRACIQNILNNYKAQGATGVRFLFGLGGGGSSTPFNADGTYSIAWMGKLSDFFSDVKTATYTKVSPTPVLVDGWSAATGSGFYQDGLVTSLCGPDVTLRFIKWLPFGLTSDTNQWPECQDQNNGYNDANANTIGCPAVPPAPSPCNFWGWTPFFNMIDEVLRRAQVTPLTVADLDIQNEFNLLDFTVVGRVIYDNKHLESGAAGTLDVFGLLRVIMGQRGGDPNRVTFSTEMKRPNVFNFDCGSFYGDTAMIMKQSELAAGLGGGVVGIPTGLSAGNNLPCGGTQGTMTPLPVSYTKPTINNIHAHVCVESSGVCTTQDATTVATNLFNGVWTFVNTHLQQPGNYVLFGETNHTQTNACAGYTVARAYELVAGFKASTLYSQDASNVVLRVWQRADDSCYTVPNTIKPPYGAP